MEKKKIGYIAVSRAIFDHPRFKNDKPLSLREAWLWLLIHANWKPRARRTKFGVIHTERGQLCITQRDLAKAWRWPKTNVDRFIKNLLEDSTIKLDRAIHGPKTWAETGAGVGYPMTMITICNYDKFQGIPKWPKGRHIDPNPDQKQLKIPGLVLENASEPYLTKNNHALSSGERTINEPRPAQGARRVDAGEVEVWWNYGTEPWIKAASDYRDFHGAAIFPEVYVGGRGNWFAEDGERIRQLRKRA